MNRLLLRTKARLRDAAKPMTEAAVGALTVVLLRTTRYFDPDKTANFFGRVTRFIGRRLREDRIGRENVCPHIDAALARAREILGLSPASPTDPLQEEKQKLETARRELTNALERASEVLKSPSNTGRLQPSGANDSLAAARK